MPRWIVAPLLAVGALLITGLTMLQVSPRLSERYTTARDAA